VLSALRGREREAYDRLREELAAQGCRAGGYRLLDADGGWSEFCCRHGYAYQRFILTFLSRSETDSPVVDFVDDERPVVLIVAVGRHNDERFYSGLGDLGVGPVGQRRAHKPACCGAGGWPTVG
jgi:hypothetical protein